MPLWTRYAQHVQDRGQDIAVGISGAGAIGAIVARAVHRTDGMRLAAVVNRTIDRAITALEDAGIPAADVAVVTTGAEAAAAAAAGKIVVCSEPDPLWELDGLDVVVESTGAMAHGFRLMSEVLRRGRDVVSMSAECDALLGPTLHTTAAEHGAVYTIADGDQPGVLFRLVEEVEGFGFEVRAALNCKRHLDVHQSPDDGGGYATRDATSLRMTTAFGDGTKLQVEQCVVANALGYGVVAEGMTGVRTTLEDLASDIAPVLDGADGPIVDFTLGGDFGAGVAVVASMPGGPTEAEATRLRMLKMGDGPNYTFFRPWHLVPFEVATTVATVVLDRLPLAAPEGPPTTTVVARAKRDLAPGRALDGQGGYDVYGWCGDIALESGRPPVGLLDDARIARPVEQDAPITWDDVEIVQHDLLEAWSAQRDAR